MLIPTILFSQDISDLQNKKLNDLSDSELLNYWTEAKKNGYDLDQIKILARAQGVSETEIKMFENRISMLDVSEEDSLENEFEIENLTSIFGNQIENQNNENLNDEIKKLNTLPFFGSDFFKNKKITPTPQLNIATPGSYELGPGDEVLISIWGAAESEYRSEITREGFLKIERLGPVYISGLTISEAKTKLKRNLSKIYSGLNNYSNTQKKVYLDISLINSRSIVVNVTGNVVAPDTYTISSLASVLNVLYAAGGPDESGSYRNIKILRNGQTIRTIDLYNYFSKGKLEPFSLRDQDVILIPDYENRVFVNGEFKNNGIFELKNGEKINDLLTYSGGVNSFGYKEKLFVKRTDGLNRRIENININKFNDFELKDGDIIEARPLTDKYTNLVTIEGAISVEGEYSLTDINNLEDLILEAGGLESFAIKDRAYLIRKNDGVENEIVSIDLNNSKNVILETEDKIIISSRIDIERQKKVRIEGEVFSPNEYPFFDGMTLIDLILIAKGLTLNGDLKNIEIYRSTYDQSKKNPVDTYKVSLDSNFSKLDDNNIKLEENDLVVIRQKIGYQEKEYVTVEGLIKYPGTYAIKTNKYTFYDLYRDFGGFLNDASLDGVKIRRKNILSELLGEEGLNTNDSINFNLSIPTFIEFGVNVKNILSTNGTDPRYNIILKSDDRIIVSKRDNSIEISGAVQQSSVVTFSKSLTVKQAINSAGGFSENAKRNSVYVVYQNGDISSTKSFLFFKNYPQLKAGSKIIIPSKNINRAKTSLTEIVGYSTSLISIIALIKNL